ncbi:bola protein [Mycena amicta]|nr:bola protein [Mycena amicta]
MATSTAGPIEQSIREKLSIAFLPSLLQIRNDSSNHSHHAAMRAQATLPPKPVHFSVQIVSALFEGKTTLQRHRLVHNTLRGELDAGLHSLSLNTKTEARGSRARTVHILTRVLMLFCAHSQKLSSAVSTAQDLPIPLSGCGRRCWLLPRLVVLIAARVADRVAPPICLVTYKPVLLSHFFLCIVSP